MMKTNAGVWVKVEEEITKWVDGNTDDDGNLATAYCLSDKQLEYYFVRRNEDETVSFPMSALVNKIGLKRRIGKILKSKGYTQTSSSPPTFVLAPKECEHDWIYQSNSLKYSLDGDHILINYYKCSKCGVTKQEQEPLENVLKPFIPTKSEIPIYILDMYLSLLQSQVIIERQFPNIVDAINR